jgi:hypothetical protein
MWGTLLSIFTTGLSVADYTRVKKEDPGESMKWLVIPVVLIAGLAVVESQAKKKAKKAACLAPAWTANLAPGVAGVSFGTESFVPSAVPGSFLPAVGCTYVLHTSSANSSDATGTTTLSFVVTAVAGSGDSGEVSGTVATSTDANYKTGATVTNVPFTLLWGS